MNDLVTFLIQLLRDLVPVLITIIGGWFVLRNERGKARVEQDARDTRNREDTTKLINDHQKYVLDTVQRQDEELKAIRADSAKLRDDATAAKTKVETLQDGLNSADKLSSDQQKEIGNLQGQLQAQTKEAADKAKRDEDRIRKLEDDLSTRSALNAGTQAALDAAITERETVKHERDQLATQLSDLNERLTKAEVRITDLSTQVDHQHELGNEASIIAARNHVLLTQQRIILSEIFKVMPKLPDDVQAALAERKIDVSAVMAASPQDDTLIISLADKDSAIRARDELLKQRSDELSQMRKQGETTPAFGTPIPEVKL